ncbi:MAG: 4Fe-4S binding protein [Candidatus Zixiibacteriota bacterium]|nr:MAG: 4Fe-4S binding protein [candidate division Zixibacteria bacterium]
MKTRHLRYALMTIILGLVIYLAVRPAGGRSFEAFCPFGGVESLWGLIHGGQFTCALGPLNLSLLVGVLALALAAKKAFCGWACPIGFLGELAARLGGKVWRRRPRVPDKTNARLKLLRYVVLVVSLYFTYRLGELVLRGFDPYYLIFSGFGHGSLGWISVLTLAVIVGLGLIVPMAFCRWLCPLSATFDPLARLGLIKVARDDHACNQCGACRRACPHDLAVQNHTVVRHRDCTNCLECVDACPVEGALSLKVTL